LSLGSSQKAEGRNCSSILPQLIIVTKEEVIRHQEEEDESRIEKLENKMKSTHESNNSNMSGSESLAVAGSPDASFRVEVLKEATSPTCFLFFSRSLSSEIAGGVGVVGPLSSRDPSASSPS
jgi:hypothetical protein